ncbi:hypothetical protein LVD17_24210 [Fulvivirga ulvae]|uniref:hypothetical protein n=1 Tax=Fulvivirga ulvae TaxID=2904245 RepID=UPI001F18C7DF|nr:hypothetical protein [Fulvivirga ulvae]UII31402.1 hypothetical protein LVD17_24210 [Fulvivirga ulvae]
MIFAFYNVILFIKEKTIPRYASAAKCRNSISIETHQNRLIQISETLSASSGVIEKAFFSVKEIVVPSASV